MVLLQYRLIPNFMLTFLSVRYFIQFQSLSRTKHTHYSLISSPPPPQLLCKLMTDSQTVIIITRCIIILHPTTIIWQHVCAISCSNYSQQSKKDKSLSNSYHENIICFMYFVVVANWLFFLCVTSFNHYHARNTRIIHWFRPPCKLITDSQTVIIIPRCIIILHPTTIIWQHVCAISCSNYSQQSKKDVIKSLSNSYHENITCFMYFVVVAKDNQTKKILES